MDNTILMFMKKSPFLNLLLLLLVFSTACGSGELPPQETSDIPLSREATVQGENETVNNILTTYDALVATLSDAEFATLTYALEGDLRRNWSNLPANITDFQRNGIRTGDLTAEQLAAVFAFLETALSADGYAKVTQVVRADEILGQSSGLQGQWFGWTEDNFWLAIFGTPSATEPWAWQFGGHHLAINVTIHGDQMVMTPTFLGVEPAIYDDNGQMFAPLEDELEKGLMVIQLLDSTQQSATIVNNRPDEVYAGAGQDGVIPDVEGSLVSDWSADQQQALLDLANEWVGLLPEAVSSAQLSTLEAALDQTTFAWHGAVDGSGSVYYRIQNPDLLIEFSIEGDLGGDAGHYHSIYRLPNNEYGIVTIGQ